MKFDKTIINLIMSAYHSHSHEKLCKPRSVQVDIDNTYTLYLNDFMNSTIMQGSDKIAFIRIIGIV